MAGTSLEELQHPERLRGSSVAFAATNHLLRDLHMLLTSQEEGEDTEVTPWVPCESRVEQRCHSQSSFSLTAFGKAAHHVLGWIGVLI